MLMERGRAATHRSDHAVWLRATGPRCAAST